MVKRSTLSLVVLSLLLAFGTCAFAQTNSSAKIDKGTCLGCHGPFDKIAKATAAWKASSGENTTPHRYVPHDSTDVPQCTECHTAHVIPLEDKATVIKPKDVGFCFDNCHHSRNLQPCKSCH